MDWCLIRKNINNPFHLWKNQFHADFFKIVSDYLPVLINTIARCKTSSLVARTPSIVGVM